MRREPAEQAEATEYQLNPLSSFLKPSNIHRSHSALTSARLQVATMSKMYDSQWDDESDDDKKSLNSSFWSDGEHQEEEEEVEIERVVREEDSKPVGEAETSLQEASEEEKPELNNQGNMSERSFQSGSNEDDEDDDDDDDDNDNEDNDDDEDEESCSSSCESPAPSLMTSGYGTYRPEEQEGGDYRDDHTITEFDQDSRGDLSEMRDDEEDDRSLCSFGGFDIESTEPDYREIRPLSALADAEPEANVALFGDDGLHEEGNTTNMTPKEDQDRTDEEKSKDQHEAAGNKVRNGAAEEQHVAVEVKDKFMQDEKQSEAGSVDVEGGKQSEQLEEEVLDFKEEKNVEKEDKVESEDPDESSSNKDIKFIDSKVDFSRMTYEEMCKEWEGNLRQMKGKWFPVTCFI